MGFDPGVHAHVYVLRKAGMRLPPSVATDYPVIIAVRPLPIGRRWLAGKGPAPTLADAGMQVPTMAARPHAHGAFRRKSPARRAVQGDRIPSPRPRPGCRSSNCDHSPPYVLKVIDVTSVDQSTPLPTPAEAEGFAVCLMYADISGSKDLALARSCIHAEWTLQD
jgi:hypothetical protein